MDDFPDRCIMCKHLIFTQALIYLPQELSFVPIDQYHYDVTLETAIYAIPLKMTNPALRTNALNPVNHSLLMSVTSFGSPLIVICEVHTTYRETGYYIRLLYFFIQKC